MEFLHGLAIFLKFNPRNEWNYTEEQKRPSFRMCVCVCPSVCLCVWSQNVSPELAPKLPDRYYWNFRWRFGRVYRSITCTQIVRAKVLNGSKETIFGRSSPNLIHNYVYYHSEITIGFDGMEFLYGLTILFFLFHSIQEWNYSEEQERPRFRMCVCLSVCLCVCLCVVKMCRSS